MLVTKAVLVGKVQHLRYNVARISGTGKLGRPTGQGHGKSQKAMHACAPVQGHTHTHTRTHARAQIQTRIQFNIKTHAPSSPQIHNYALIAGQGHHLETQRQ
jgi:hypothetical protein